VITAINLLVPFITLQISDGVFRWLITAKTDRDRQIALSSSVFIALLGLVVCGVICGITFMIWPIQRHVLITALSLSAILYPLFQQVARGLGRSKLFAASGVVYTIIYLLGNLFFLVFLDLGIDALFYSTIIAYVFATGVLLTSLKLGNTLKLKAVDREVCKEMLRYSIPLIPNTISWWLINSANKYIILFFLGINANGLFAMSNRFPVILVMVNQVFTLAWQESAIASFGATKDTSKYSFILDRLIKVQFSLVILLSLFSQFFASKFLSSSFYESWLYMPPLYLGAAFLTFSSFFGAFYLGAKKTTQIFTTTIYAGIINLIAAPILIPHIGLYGVAIATSLGYFSLFVIRVFLTRSFVKFDLPMITFLKYSCIVVMSFLLSYYGVMEYSVIGAVVFLVYLFIDNRNEVFQLVAFLTKKLKKI